MKNMVLNPIADSRIKTSIPLFLFAISLIACCLLYKKMHNNNDLIKSFVIMQLYVYAISLLHGFDNIDNYLLLLTPLLTMLFSRHIASYPENNKLINVLFVLVFFGMSVLYFSLERYSLAYGDSEYFHSNSSYIVLYLLPFLLCNKSKWIRYGGLLVTILVVLVSSKRGGTIAVALGLLSFILVERKVQISKRNKVGFAIGMIVFLVVGFFVVNGALKSTDNYILNRFVEVDDEHERGRGSIYPVVFNMIVNSSLGQQCFGHGYNMVKEDSPIGLSAHNDFLEMAYDIGIIGVILLVVFLFRLIKYETHLIKKKSPYASGLAFATAVLFTNMMVSHIIFAASYLMVFSMLYGYIVGKEELEDLVIIDSTDENRSISIPIGD